MGGLELIFIGFLVVFTGDDGGRVSHESVWYGSLSSIAERVASRQ
jgi:hypothetical protein